ncbi:TPA: hypothetical protein ACWV7H_004699, partial [Salmonella enterica subsp. enterica serovar Muenchen]
LVTGTEVNGVSQSGTGVKTQGNVTLKGVELSAESKKGDVDLNVTGTLDYDKNTVIKAKRIVGLTQGNTGDNDESILNDNWLVSVLRQQAVIVQVTRMNQAAQDGFHSAGTTVVPVAKYQEKSKKVKIILCDEDRCVLESLDAVEPTEGVVTSFGK